MPLQNRVLPTGEIVQHPARGGLTGNRGILHKPDGTLGVSRWQHPHWVCCALSFRGRSHGPMPERGWTALFFLDEAVALAAGHRPCHHCRYADAMRFRDAWRAAHDGPCTAGDIDRLLHPTRVTRARQQVRFQAQARDLPPGAFILHNTPLLLLSDAALPFDPRGYGAPVSRPTGAVTVLTPQPIVRVLRAGYHPVLHASAGTEH